MKRIRSLFTLVTLLTVLFVGLSSHASADPSWVTRIKGGSLRNEQSVPIGGSKIEVRSGQIKIGHTEPSVEAPTNISKAEIPETPIIGFSEYYDPYFDKMFLGVGGSMAFIPSGLLELLYEVPGRLNGKIFLMPNFAIAASTPPAERLARNGIGLNSDAFTKASFGGNALTFSHLVGSVLLEVRIPWQGDYFATHWAMEIRPLIYFADLCNAGGGAVDVELAGTFFDQLPSNPRFEIDGATVEVGGYPGTGGQVFFSHLIPSYGSGGYHSLRIVGIGPNGREVEISTTWLWPDSPNDLWTCKG
jgi:hypothetical protein